MVNRINIYIHTNIYSNSFFITYQRRNINVDLQHKTGIDFTTYRKVVHFFCRILSLVNDCGLKIFILLYYNRKKVVISIIIGWNSKD